MEKVDSPNYKFIKIKAELRIGIIISVAIRTGIGQTVVTKDNTDKTEIDLDMIRVTEEEISEET